MDDFSPSTGLSQHRGNRGWLLVGGMVGTLVVVAGILAVSLPAARTAEGIGASATTTVTAAVTTTAAATSTAPPAQSDEQRAGPALSARSEEQPFGAAGDEHEETHRRFIAGLRGVVEAGEAVSPKVLVEQAAEPKSIVLATLPDPGKKLDPATLYASVRRSVVIVGGLAKPQKRHRWQASFATGFVLHKDGIIASNAHVLEAFAHMDAVGVMTDQGRVFPVLSVVAADRTGDVALLKIDADDLVPLPVAQRAPVGSTIYCLSHPVLNCMGTENAFFTMTQGIISGRQRFRAGSQPLLDWITVTADYAEGSSGGPILSETGAVVGVVCQTLALGDAYEGTPQMVWKLARPAESLLALVRGPSPGGVSVEP